MNNTGIFGDMGFSHIDALARNITALGLIDIGVIMAYRPSDGTADVNLYSTIMGVQRTITNVEVIFFGNNANGFKSAVAGSPCLIVYPCSVVPSIKNKEIDASKRAYDKTGAKCIPLSVVTNTPLQVGFNSKGDLTIGSDNYTVSITERGITYSNADNSLQYDLSGSTGISKIEGYVHTEIEDDGTVWIYYKNASGKVAYLMNYKPDGTYVINRTAFEAWDEAAEDDHSTFTKYMWKETVNPDGSRQLLQQNSNNEVLNQIDISATGDITIAQTKAENTVTLRQDGTCSITTKSKTTITGTAVEVNGASGKVAIKNSSKSLFTDVLKALLDLLNGTSGSVKTAGSPGSQTVVPGQFSSISTALAALME